MGIADNNVELSSPELLVYFKLLPFLRDRGGYFNAVQEGTYAQDPFHTAHHDCGSCAGKPVNMRPSQMRTVRPFRKLAVAVGFNDSYLCPVVLHGRCIFTEVPIGPAAMAEKRFGQYEPSLRLGENACIFFGARVVNDCQCSFKGMGVVGRRHEDCTIGSV